MCVCVMGEHVSHATGAQMGQSIVNHSDGFCSFLLGVFLQICISLSYYYYLIMDGADLWCRVC